jgi:hypothetical protein
MMPRSEEGKGMGQDSNAFKIALPVNLIEKGGLKDLARIRPWRACMIITMTIETKCG